MKMMPFGGGYYSILKVNYYREARCVLPMNKGGVACSLLLSAGGINSYTRQLVKLQARQLKNKCPFFSVAFNIVSAF